MSLPTVLNYGVMAVLIGLVASGCSPTGSTALDEQKEPHFLRGKARVSAMDFGGAIESFEKALEVNPRSSSAHLELGLLYEKNEQDYAAAIYHFDRHLRLTPHSEYSQIVTQRIMACKQELARSVSLAPVTQTMQRDLERLAAENAGLKQKLDELQLAGADRGVPANSRTLSRSEPVAIARGVSDIRTPQAPARTPVASGGGARTASTGTTLRAHRIAAGESPYAIARRYGVKLDLLMAANPGVDARRLKVGQTLTIPAS